VQALVDTKFTSSWRGAVEAGIQRLDESDENPDSAGTECEGVVKAVDGMHTHLSMLHKSE
jgi:hypothetical protein